MGGLSSETMWKVGGQVVWSPVKDLNIGTELTYMRLNQHLTEQRSCRAVIGCLPLELGRFPG